MTGVIKQSWQLVSVLLIVLLSACAGSPTASPSNPGSMENLSRKSSEGSTGSAPAGGAVPQQRTNSDQNQPASGPVPQVQLDDRKIIRTGSMAIIVKSPDVAVADVTRIATSLRGFVLSAQISESGSYRIASMSIKVPTESYNDALNQIRQLAVKVRNETSTAQDVTEEFNDVQTQLKTLRTQYDTYLELLKNARTVDDALRIRTRIDEIQAQINRLEGRLNFLDKNAQLSTINLTITQAEAERSIIDNEWSPLTTLRNALNAFLLFARGVLDLLIYLVIFGWPFVLLGLAIRWWMRRRVRPAMATPPPPPPPA